MTDISVAEQVGAPAPAAPTDNAVDIITVNWNAGEQLAECLRSVARNGGATVRRVFVVDNGSTDGSADMAPPAGLPVELIRAGRNLGFGRACNLAAEQATAPYLLFLNPDAELGEGALERAVAYIMADPGVGVVGTKLVGRDGAAHHHCARFPDWHSFIGNSLGLTRILRRWFPPIPLLEFDHLTSRSVEHVMGAFYLIRRDLFEQLGGFDERFFVYLEDLDLSRRVVSAGYRIEYLADVSSYHKQGGVSEQVKAHRLFYALQSNILYAFKHLSRPQAWLVAAVTLAVEPVSRVGRSLLRLSPREARDTLAGFGMLYRALPQIARAARRPAEQTR